MDVISVAFCWLPGLVSRDVILGLKYYSYYDVFQKTISYTSYKLWFLAESRSLNEESSTLTLRKRSNEDQKDAPKEAVSVKRTEDASDNETEDVAPAAKSDNIEVVQKSPGKKPEHQNKFDCFPNT